jgi:hypothetical protein
LRKTLRILCGKKLPKRIAFLNNKRYVRKRRNKEIIIEQGMLPLYYHPSSEVSIAVLEALYKAGVKAIEYTNRGEHAIGKFQSHAQTGN